MKDTANKNKAEEKKKDYYTPVMLCQIIGAVVLFLFYSLFISSSSDKKAELLSYLNKELFSTNDIVSAVKGYFSSDGTWEVFGSLVTVKDSGEENGDTTDLNTTATVNSTNESTNKEESTDVSEDTTSDFTNLSGTGGDDLEIYEAASNTSFAKIKTTAPAIKPVENGRYTSYFGYRINPITGKFSFHTGLDIAAAEGTKIRAAYSGVVAKTGEDERAGKYILLQHDDGFATFYCHCSSVLAYKGTVIRQGETIALIGTTGYSTGPHLHFEIRKDNIRYNPIYILENDA